MTDQNKIDESNSDHQQVSAPPGSREDRRATAGALKRLPGLIAIAIYMVILAGVVIIGVVHGYFPALYLAFPVFFFAAALGLLMLFRWAWALTLAAILLLAAAFFYLSVGHGLAFLVQGLLNLVFFLYLVRTEVRASLR